MADILQQVQTYNDSNLGALQNQMPVVSAANTKFKNFAEDTAKNLGDTVGFDLPPRFTVNDTLVATFQDTEQRVQTLTVNSAKNVAYNFTAQQFIFNVKDYMGKFGMNAMAELATKVETDVSTVAVNNTYRTAGTGLSGTLSSYTALAQAIAAYKNYGAPKGNIKVFLPDTIVPTIIGNGLGQFTPKRNDAEANSWQLGDFQGVNFYSSNLLPPFVAGVAGQSASEVVINSIDSTGTVLTVTVSSLLSQAGAFAAGDILTFGDNTTVGGTAKLRFLTFVGHQPCAQKVQVRITAASDTNGSGVATLTVSPALIGPTLATTLGARNQNINKDIASTMTASVLPSHRAGFICGGDALYVGMPKLPDEDPFKTAISTDPDTGVSMRTYYGATFGQNQRGIVHDVLYGYTAVPEYMMRLAFEDV